MSKEAFLSTMEVARRLGLSVERVRELANAGVVPVAGRSGVGRVFRATDIDRLAASRSRHNAEGKS